MTETESYLKILLRAFTRLSSRRSKISEETYSI